MFAMTKVYVIARSETTWQSTISLEEGLFPCYNTRMAYDKNLCAPVPPMGWNSYDYYNTMVNEQQVRHNAEYMAKNLKQHGWEYVVIDIQWSDPFAGEDNANRTQYIPFSHFCIDE